MKFSFCLVLCYGIFMYQIGVSGTTTIAGLCCLVVVFYLDSLQADVPEPEAWGTNFFFILSLLSSR